MNEGNEVGAVSRRAIISGAEVGFFGAAAVVGPRAYRRIRRESLGATPSSRVAVTDLSFRSVARGRDVGCFFAGPDDLAKDAPIVVWLHGRGRSAQSVMNQLRIPNFLAAALAAGVPPFGVVSVEGGASYWHRRRNGDDPEAMVVDELPNQLGAIGRVPRSWGIAGWSMGGYGALSIAQRHAQFRAVAASSAAVWFRAGDTREGAFDDAEDFKAHDVLANLDRLPPHVWIDCGSQDPFASTSRHMLDKIVGVKGSMSEGAHNMRFWRRVLPDQLRFLGESLAA